MNPAGTARLPHLASFEVCDTRGSGIGVPQPDGVRGVATVGDGLVFTRLGLNSFVRKPSYADAPMHRTFMQALVLGPTMATNEPLVPTDVLPADAGRRLPQPAGMGDTEILIGVGIVAGVALGVASAAVLFMIASNGLPAAGGQPGLTVHDVIRDDAGRIQTVETVRGIGGGGLPGLPASSNGA